MHKVLTIATTYYPLCPILGTWQFLETNVSIYMIAVLICHICQKRFGWTYLVEIWTKPETSLVQNWFNIIYVRNVSSSYTIFGWPGNRCLVSPVSPMSPVADMRMSCNDRAGAGSDIRLTANRFWNCWSTSKIESNKLNEAMNFSNFGHRMGYETLLIIVILLVIDNVIFGESLSKRHNSSGEWWLCDKITKYWVMLYLSSTEWYFKCLVASSSS